MNCVLGPFFLQGNTRWNCDHLEALMWDWSIQVAIGLVVALDYKNPYMNPYEEYQVLSFLQPWWSNSTLSANCFSQFQVFCAMVAPKNYLISMLFNFFLDQGLEIAGIEKKVGTEELVVPATAEVQAAPINKATPWGWKGGAIWCSHIEWGWIAGTASSATTSWLSCFSWDNSLD